MAPRQGHGYEKTGLSPDGALLVRNRGRLVELYDVKSQQRTGLLDGHTASIEAIAFHGEDRFVTADSNGSILVWDRNAIEAIGGGHEVIKEEFA